MTSGSMQLDELWKLVKSVPHGRVATYGSLGAALKHPASGYMVGRWMAQCPIEVPWWRVVAKSGILPIGKRDPHAEREQRELLEREGVRFLDGRIDMETHCWTP